MADLAFEHPRLASIYDALEDDRGDLELYRALVAEFQAERVLDVGCGTGTLALLLADDGVQVTAVDPAAASLDVARGKPGGQRVRWLHGTAASLPELQVDLVTMTGNVAQAIADPHDWEATLMGVHAALRPGGRLVFETRDPARRQWEEWTPAATLGTTLIPGVGAVRGWLELLDVSLPLVTFRGTCMFEADGAVLTSESTLRFRERDEVQSQLEQNGFSSDDVRDAPDRPGREFVFVARRQQDR